MNVSIEDIKEIAIQHDNLLDSESKEIIYKNFISDFKVLGYDK